MGNCQASDAVATLVEYPNGRVERLYWTVSARQVMLQNPGHYIGVYIWPKPTSPPSAGPRRKPKLKILPPSAILVAGHCYRLVSFEEALENLSGAHSRRASCTPGAFSSAPSASKRSRKRFEDSELAQVARQQQHQQQVNNTGMSFARQWQPSLQSISETVNML